MIRKYHQFYLKGRPNHVAPDLMGNYVNWWLHASLYQFWNRFQLHMEYQHAGVPLSKTGYLTSRGEAGEVGIIVTLPLRCTIRGICSKQRCFLNFKGTVYEGDSCV